VHGTLVVPTSGGYETEDIQRGKVTAISNSSVMVVSPDKYTKTYHVTGSTSVNAGNGGLSTVKVGDQVSVAATVHGSTATVSSIIDLSRLGNGRFAPGGGNQGQPSS
jgi:ribosomal protein S1